MTNTNNRPGNMETVYEKRTDLNKFGKIISYNDKFKTMIIKLSDGAEEVLSWSTFRSVWRKKQESATEVLVETAVKLSETEVTPIDNDIEVVENVTEAIQEPINESETVEAAETIPYEPKALKKQNLKLKELTYKGETKSIKEWAAEIDMPWPTLYDRVNRNGWPVNLAIETPLGQRRPK